MANNYGNFAALILNQYNQAMARGERAQNRNDMLQQRAEDVAFRLEKQKFLEGEAAKRHQEFQQNLGFQQDQFVTHNTQWQKSMDQQKFISDRAYNQQFLTQAEWKLYQDNGLISPNEQYKPDVNRNILSQIKSLKYQQMMSSYYNRQFNTPQPYTKVHRDAQGHVQNWGTEMISLNDLPNWQKDKRNKDVQFVPTDFAMKYPQQFGLNYNDPAKQVKDFQMKTLQEDINAVKGFQTNPISSNVGLAHVNTGFPWNGNDYNQGDYKLWKDKNPNGNERQFIRQRNEQTIQPILYGTANNPTSEASRVLDALQKSSGRIMSMDQATTDAVYALRDKLVRIKEQAQTTPFDYLNDPWTGAVHGNFIDSGRAYNAASNFLQRIDKYIKSYEASQQVPQKKG